MRMSCPMNVATSCTRINELDLMLEGANTAQLKRDFAGSDLLYVPEVFWDYCRPQALVPERIYGIPIKRGRGR